jgi:hypothetical protein
VLLFQEHNLVTEEQKLVVCVCFVCVHSTVRVPSQYRNTQPNTNSNSNSSRSINSNSYSNSYSYSYSNCIKSVSIKC